MANFSKPHRLWRIVLVVSLALNVALLRDKVYSTSRCSLQVAFDSALAVGADFNTGLLQRAQATIQAEEALCDSLDGVDLPALADACRNAR